MGERIGCKINWSTVILCDCSTDGLAISPVRLGNGFFVGVQGDGGDRSGSAVRQTVLKSGRRWLGRLGVGILFTLEMSTR